MTQECPRCFGMGRTADDDKYDRNCSCLYLLRIAELENTLSFYADANNYVAEEGKRSKIAGDAWGTFARIVLQKDEDPPTRPGKRSRVPALAEAIGVEYRGKVSTGGGSFGAMQTLAEVQALRGLSPATPETWTPSDRVLVLEKALRSILDSMGEFVRQSMHMSPEWRSGIEAAEQALLDSMRAGQPERIAIKAAVENALGFLPTTHMRGCKHMADRECGFCDCGYEAGANLRKLVRQ